MRSHFSSLIKFLILGAIVASSPPTPAVAAEESCASCSTKVTFSGDFSHFPPAGRRGGGGGGRRGGGAAAPILGARAGTEQDYRDAIVGPDFSATITGLHDGKYTVSVGVIELSSENPAAGARVFDVSMGDLSLAKGLDILATAGAPDKVYFITGTADHRDDSIGGPIVLKLHATTGSAKLNTLEVKDASGATLVYVHASDLVDQADLPARQVPVVSGPVLWTDPSQPRAARIKDLISRMSLAEKVHQMNNDAPAIRRDGLTLPGYNYWSEALHGVANTGGVTVFPEPVGSGASFDTNLVYQMGHFIGIEGRAKNNQARARNNGDSPSWNGLNFWAPNINMFRDPRWGRGQETYGEDPFLTSRMGVAFITGMQGNDPKYSLALACAKHYAVHSGPESQRHTIDVHPTDRDLYETYLPQFEAAAKEAHVAAFMSAYSALNGMAAPASKFLLQTTLRDRWGFDGHVVSDCDAVSDVWRNHGNARNEAEGSALSVIAGTDLCCGSQYNSLLTAMKSNYLTTNQLELALTRILDSRFRLGLFDPTNVNPLLAIGMDQCDTAEHRQLSLQLARESMVLLKNNGLLPLDRSKYKKIAVVGPNATGNAVLNGNYNGTASRYVNILDGIRQVAGSGIEVSYSAGSPVEVGGRGGFGRRGGAATPARPPEELRAEALSNAANADLVIFVGGITPSQEGEGRDRTAIELPEVQDQLIRALHATGKPVVMVNCGGSDVAFPWEADNLPAILQAWYPGEEGGRAVAETLFGDNNPGGKLPVTFYTATTELPAFTNYSMENRTYKYYTGKPLYAFGHGLSYTKFDYSAPSLAAKSVKVGGSLTVTFDVKNSGKVDGDEVAQVYFSHDKSAVPQAIKALCAFKRVHVAAGKSEKVSFDIPLERLRYWDTTKNDYTVEAGNYHLMVGAASDDIRQTTDFSVTR